MEVPAATRTRIQEVDIKSIHQQENTISPVYPTKDDLSIVQFHTDLQQLYGNEARHSLLVSGMKETKNALFHGSCVYAKARQELYITSNLLPPTNSSKLPVILISRIKLKRKSSLLWESPQYLEQNLLRPPPNMPMPSGASQYRDSIIYCSQGSSTAKGGIFKMPFGRPPEPLVTSYFGRDFNSVQDVVSSGSVLWFTDSAKGFENEIRPPPRLPNHVYRYDSDSGELRVVANNLTSPSGIAISNDHKTLYVSDIGSQKSDGSRDPNRPTGIYAFDVQDHSGTQFLANKRLFAYPRDGTALRIHCDGRNNILAACGDGIEVWNSSGILLGVLEVPGGASSFGMDDQEIFICSEQRLWWMGFLRDE